MHVVVGVVDLARLAHAGAASAGIDESNVQRAAKDALQPLRGRRAIVAVRGPLIAGFPGYAGALVAAATEAMNASPVVNSDYSVLTRNRPRWTSFDQGVCLLRRSN